MKKALAIAIGITLAGTACEGQEGHTAETSKDTGAKQPMSFARLDVDQGSRLSEEEVADAGILDPEGFARADANQDDYVSQTEFQSVSGSDNLAAGGTKTGGPVIAQRSFETPDGAPLVEDEALDEKAPPFDALDADRNKRLDPAEVDKVTFLEAETWVRADTNQDSYLSQSEYDIAKSEFLTGSSATATAWNFEDLDVNQDSLLSEQEATDSQVLDSEAFASADANQDGFLSRTEFDAGDTGLESEDEIESELDDGS